MFIKITSIVITMTLLVVLIACEPDACMNYQDLCDDEADMTMCNELLEEQPSSLYTCMSQAETCAEIHSCILNVEDESLAKSN